MPSRRQILLRLAAATATAVAVAARSVVGAPSGAPAFTPTSTSALRLRMLIEASDAAALALDPLPRVGADWSSGVAPFIDPLAARSMATVERQARRDLAQLRRIDRAGLPPADLIAYQAFEYRCAREVLRFSSGVAGLQTLLPLNASSGLHLELPDYVSGAGAPFNTAADYEAGRARLAGFSQYLGSLVRRLREGAAQGLRHPQGVVRQVIGQCEAMLALDTGRTPFDAALTRFPESIAASRRARFTQSYERTIRNDVLPAYARLRDFLRSEYLPRASATPGRAALPGGDALYAFELDQHTTLPSNAGRIHELGMAEVQRIRAQMEQVRGQVGFDGSLPAFFEFVRTDPQFYFSKPEDLLARFKEIETRIWQGMPRLFSRRPRAPFGVRALPSIGNQRGTGYYRPGPPDGITPGVLWFNMAMLNTRPIPTLETLTLHEGIPGHHYQITLALEDASLPAILRFGSLTAYSEGWGLYAESLGPELGLFTDPYQLFGHLDMAMLRAVRLVVDTGLHAQLWDRQRAINFMLANTSMAARDVAVEIDRYISWPGQACAYKVGELKIRELREHATRIAGTGFDVRRFHSSVLDTGALPLTVLDSKIRSSLTTEGAPAAG